MKTFNILSVLLICILCFSNCEGYTDESTSDTGEGGSTSRFTIVNNYMYTVDNKYLKVFDITSPSDPVMIGKNEVGFAIETIYSINGLLFIGSQGAMYIYDIADPEKPVKLSQTSHVYSCDPVVADNDYAYVTLRSGSSCRSGWNNELQVIDITDPTNTLQVGTYELESPYGLDIKGNQLFVCTKNQVVVFDKSDPLHLVELYTIPVAANDIIAIDTILLFVTDRAMYEYTYTDNTAAYLSDVYKID